MKKLEKLRYLLYTVKKLSGCFSSRSTISFFITVVEFTEIFSQGRNRYDPTPLPDDDNIRVYLPMDICKSAILRRLADVISLYGYAAEANEMDFSYDVNSLISQIDI